jgi:hypothetical protein
MLQFKLERFLFRKDGMLHHFHKAASVFPNAMMNGHVLRLIVDGNIALCLHDLKLTETPFGDPAHKDVRHRSVGEADLGGGHVFEVGTYGTSHCGNVDDFRVDEREDDVDIVDHEIKDDSHVAYPRGKGAESPRLEKERRMHDIGHMLHRAVETLDVSHLKDQVSFRCDSQKDFGFLDRGSDGLFDEHVNAFFKSLSGDIVVGISGYHDTDRIGLRGGGKSSKLKK